MKLSGMNSMYRFFSLNYFFRSMKECEISNVELWTSPHHFFVDYSGYDNTSRLKNALSEYNFNIHCICPEQTNPKMGNLAVGNPQDKKRMINYFKNQIDLANELNATKVLVTAGWGYLDEKRISAWNRMVH